MTRLEVLLGHLWPLERETELPSQISSVDVGSRMRRSQLHRLQHPHVGIVLCAGVRAFDPSLGVGWKEILSCYPMEWAMEMMVDLGVAQQELPGTEDTGNANWY